jgi:hypothetical protein
MQVQTRGRFARVLHNRSRHNFGLAYSVSTAAPSQGPLRYPGGVKLVIENDDLGIFADAENVFWAVRQQSFEVIEVIMYPPTHGSAPRHGSWGGWGAGSGHALRPFFFAESPGVGISLGQKSPDHLIFNGFDSSKAAEWGSNVLHFVRQVEAAEKLGELSSAFEEHTWFAYGKGLVELRQFVSGKQTMHWLLRDFRSAGR